jgi:DNA polymerase I
VSNANVGDEVKLNEKDGTLGVYLGTEWDENEGLYREWFWNKPKGDVVWRVPEIRECIVARKGYKILAADYSQIEIKLMAFLSNDPDMIRALNTLDARGNPTDIHCYISTMVYGERLKFDYEEMISVIKEKAPGGKKHPRYKEFKRMRSNIKNTTFGVPYGSGAKGVADRCGITEEEAQQVIDDFFKQFPKLKVWLDEQGSLARKKTYTETPYGRKRFYDMPSRQDLNAKEYGAMIDQIRRWAGNHPIQAASADMLKEALRLIYRGIRGGDINGSDRYAKLSGPKLYDASIIMVVHDEIVMECREEQAEEVKLLMEKCMGKAYENIIGDVIPNKIDVAVESSWEKV